MSWLEKLKHKMDAEVHSSDMRTDVACALKRLTNPKYNHAQQAKMLRDLIELFKQKKMDAVKDYSLEVDNINRSLEEIRL